MALTSSYLITTKNLDSFLNSLLTARAPEVFTQKFLESLEFKSTNDRLFIAMLKGLGFLDQTAVPTERYFKFLDQTQSKQILAEGIREAYEDLFSVNTKAQELTQQEVKSKLKTLTQGKPSDKVLGLMATTFKALVDYAEWATSSNPKPSNTKKSEEESAEKKTQSPKPEEVVTTPPEEEKKVLREAIKTIDHQLHYNIQIHLPESRDQAVYDAIFKSLKNHLF